MRRKRVNYSGPFPLHVTDSSLNQSVVILAFLFVLLNFELHRHTKLLSQDLRDDEIACRGSDEFMEGLGRLLERSAVRKAAVHRAGGHEDPTDNEGKLALTLEVGRGVELP